MTTPVTATPSAATSSTPVTAYGGTSSSADYYAQAEQEIEALASSGGSPAIVSILSLMLKGVSARAPSTP